MFGGMLHLHNFMRWLVVIFAIWAIISLFSGKSSGKSFTKKDRLPALLYMIFLDIQLLVGLVLYFMGGLGIKNLSNGVGEVMKNTVARFYAVEHLVGMLIVVVLAHIANAYAKKDIPDQTKFSKMAYFILVSFILLLLFIPWPFREVGFNRGWFPGM